MLQYVAVPPLFTGSSVIDLVKYATCSENTLVCSCFGVNTTFPLESVTFV